MKKLKPSSFLLLITIFLATTVGCAGNADSAKKNNNDPSIEISEIWLPLRAKLAADSVSSTELDIHFSNLSNTITQDPMGRKITELYYNKYVKSVEPKKNPNYDQPPSDAFKTPGPWYKNVVSEKNAKTCLEFIKKYPNAFEKAHKTYGVPSEIAAALLFVETRLGNYLGSENAFYTLASMASSKHISQIPDFIEKLPDYSEDKDAWANDLMQVRSEWAYNELKALAEHVLENNLDPFEMPGSIYGAIGYCQFMPSNLKMYTADGNDDGVINLFDPEDAIMSLSKYLSFYKWNTAGTLSAKQATLRKYNNLTVYANTILALGEQINMLR